MESIIIEIARVLHLTPDETKTVKGFTFYERLDQASQGRSRAEQELSEAQENHGEGPPFDPLLHKLEQLAHMRAEIDEQIRCLIVYARHFVRPRPYPLATLAKASRMSPSGIRLTSNDEDRMLEIARNIHRSDNSGRIAPPEDRAAAVELADDLADFRNQLDAANARPPQTFSGTATNDETRPSTPAGSAGS
ncbi:hypothetical protein [Nonomuraea angiospora]